MIATTDGGYLFGGSSTSGTSGDKTQSSRGGTDYWLIKVISSSTSAAITQLATEAVEPAEKEATLVKETFKSYPNPFNDQLFITFTLPETQLVTIKVYDLQGNEIAELFNKESAANKAQEIEWRPKGNQPVGIYILRLSTPKYTKQKKIIIAK